MRTKSRRYLLAVLAAAGCASRSAAPPLPKEAPGGWRMAGMREASVESAPEAARALGVVRAWEVDYQGPAEVRVRVFEMKAQASAFELAQKWRPGPDTVFLYQGAYFVLVESAGSDRNTLTGLANVIDSALGKR